jgi:probable HAF family extracellular repeat protein
LSPTHWRAEIPTITGSNPANEDFSGRLGNTTAASAIDLLAAAPLVSATTLAAALDVAVETAIRLLDGLAAAGIAVEVTRRSKRRLFGLKGMASLADAVCPPYRPELGRGRGRPPRSSAGPSTTATSSWAWRSSTWCSAGPGDRSRRWSAANVDDVVSTIPEAINDRGEVAGAYFDSSHAEHGFVYDNGAYTTLNVRGATETFADAINDRGEVAGNYDDSSGTEHGFVYDNGRFTRLTVPGATSTSTLAINDRGEVVGNYGDSSGTEHGFVYDDGRFIRLNVPGASDTIAADINNRGEVVGTYKDSSGVYHGFVYDDGRYSTLNVPGATGTTVTAINDRGEVVGTYGDPTATGGEQGFLATPQGGEASAGGFGFGELLSAHARHGGVNDLLPGIPGIRGGSPHTANASGMMDQAFAVGARFAPFGGLESDHGMTQAWLHGNGTCSGTG